ncbi:MAG: hypothetical protein ACOYXC_19705 [Candidatus Rifleibacteriota bacterium]
MKCLSQTAAGSIRDHNQDFWLINEKAGLAMVADGTGPDGARAAAELLNLASALLLENAHVFSAEEAPQKLAEAFAETQKRNGAHLTESIKGFAAIWLHRQQISLVWSGSCRVESAARFCGKIADRIPEIRLVSLPVQPGSAFMLSSEGVVMALNNQYFSGLAHDLCLKPGSEKFEFFWKELARDYDGDDRTLLLIDIEEADRKLGCPKEIELFTDFDRQFSIPLWLPASLGAIFSVTGLWLLRKIYFTLKENPVFIQLKKLAKENLK